GAPEADRIVEDGCAGKRACCAQLDLPRGLTVEEEASRHDDRRIAGVAFRGRPVCAELSIDHILDRSLYVIEAGFLCLRGILDTKDLEDCRRLGRVFGSKLRRTHWPVHCMHCTDGRDASKLREGKHAQVLIKEPRRGGDIRSVERYSGKPG